MPKISFKSEDGEGGGWEPLPKGTYHLIIDDISEEMSTKGNRQLKVSTHVSEGPHEGKKNTLWYAMTAKSGWKMEMLLEATGIDWEKVETDETNPDTGKPLNELEFDTDDLIGSEIVVDASIEKYQGKDQQRFNDERSPDGNKSASNGNGKQEAAPADDSGTEAAPAAEQSAGRSRRRRV